MEQDPRWGQCSTPVVQVASVNVNITGEAFWKEIGAMGVLLSLADQRGLRSDDMGGWI